MKEGAIVIKRLKILSIIHSTLWFAFFTLSIIAKYFYNAPDADPVDFALSKGVYNAFIFIAVMGLFSSMVLSISMYVVSKHKLTKKSFLKKATLTISILTNLLFYISIYLLFVINSDSILVIPVIWGLCVITCLVLLIIIIRNERCENVLGERNE